MRPVLYLILLFSSICAIAQENNLLFSNSNYTESRYYVAFKTTEPINIDGRDFEEDWQNASFTEDFVDILGFDIPQFQTRAKILWDEDYLYIYAYLEEEHIWANLLEHDAIIYHDNDFEVFIDPDNDGRNYSEIEVNALNTTWDLILDKPYRLGGTANDYFEMQGLQTAIYIDGTLNDPTDLDNYWSVEMAIPMESILLAKHRKQKFPRNRDIWRLNFSRVEWQFDIIDSTYQRKKVNGKLLPEENWVWSPMGEVNMHIPELWGYIQFSIYPVGAEIPYQPEAEEISRQVSYELFRRFKFGDLIHFTDRKQGFTKTVPPFSIQDQNFEATYYKTPHGFEVIIDNTTLSKRYMIDDSGYLYELQD